MPETFTIEYNGQPVEFTKCDRGYAFHCPKHSGLALNWIDTESGTHHSVTFDEQSRATIVGSLLCRSPLGTDHECGWHVKIENGVATDC